MFVVPKRCSDNASSTVLNEASISFVAEPQQEYTSYFVIDLEFFIVFFRSISPRSRMNRVVVSMAASR